MRYGRISGSETPVGASFRSPTARQRRIVGKVAPAIVVLMACAFLLLFIAAPAPAFAATTQLDSPVTVSDDVTRVQVSKLDADTHGYVQGATMAIIEEDTGKIVDQWVTGSSSHEASKTLNVGTVYILREISAPSGYEKVQDVRFQVNETEGSGVTVLSSGDDSELTESYKFALYDKPTSGENVTTATKTTSSTTVAPKTGDETPMSLILGLVGLGISAILIIQLFKRRLRDE